ncbi:MAG: hypothetical protein ACREDR_40740, partial [Blastocatellia bacterium]
MLMKTSAWFAGFVIALLSCVGATANGRLVNRQSAAARNADARSVTILLTAGSRNKKNPGLAASLKAEDLTVKENGRPQKVLSLKSLSAVPPSVEVLIQDNLARGLNNQLDGIREFIRGLPEGSRVLTGYVTQGSLDVRQEFTTDRNAA